MTKLWLTLALWWSFTGTVLAQPVPVPPLVRHVTDLTATLDQNQLEQLDAKLMAFEQRKGSQIAVLVVPTTNGEPVEQYALRVAERWKLGRKKVDDGAVLLVAKNDRTLRIEVGYGLEGALNDATAKRIIEEIILPRFHSNDYAGGIDAGIDSMLKVIDGEGLAPVPVSRNTSPSFDFPHFLPAALVAIVLIGSLLRAILGRLGGAAVTSGIIGAGVWMLAGSGAAILAAVIAFLFTLVGSRRMALAGLYLGQSGGGGGGGGWGGGGGGGFGGGGASGKW